MRLLVLNMKSQHSIPNEVPKNTLRRSRSVKYEEVISRCRFAEDGKKCIDLQRACTPIVLLIKAFNSFFL